MQKLANPKRRPFLEANESAYHLASSVRGDLLHHPKVSRCVVRGLIPRPKCVKRNNQECRSRPT